MSKRRRASDDANTLDLILLLSMPVLTAIVTAIVWYLGDLSNQLAV